MTVEDVVFALLGVVAVGSGVLVVTTKQLVHAALWLVVSFGALAGGYLVLTAEFVAWVQVLIYVGAVVVLLLFGIMLTRAPIGRSDDLDSGNRIPALVVALATAGVLVTVLAQGFRNAHIRPCGSGWFAYSPLDVPPRRPCLATGGTSSTLGAAIFRNWVLPFEVLSVLLLAALVGAIMLSKRGPDGAATTTSSGPKPPSTRDQRAASTKPGKPAGAERAETGKPEARRPETGKAETGRPGAGRPGAERAGAGRPGAERAGAGRPGAERAGAGRAEAHAEAGEPEVSG